MTAPRPAPLLVECGYCRVTAPIAEMKVRPGGAGFVCKDVPACDARDDLAFYGEAETDDDTEGDDRS
jgi:hypothetical protein